LKISKICSFFRLYFIIAGLYHILPLFQNIRCFSFVKQMYLDIF
jgi:hypothetical protein